MSTTVKDIRTLFRKLKRAERQSFPKQGGMTDVPDEPGVYIVYSPRSRRVFYVGKTARATLRKRFESHLYGRSEHHGSKWRNGYEFRCLPVRSARHRTLLEAYAIGCLCPKYLGTGAIKRSPSPCLAKPGATGLGLRACR
jgi:GIY-YIG catalytic domain-containing protein